MSRRIERSASDIGPALEEIEAGSADEIDLTRDGRTVARLVRPGHEPEAPLMARSYAWDGPRSRRRRDGGGSFGRFLANLIGLAVVGGLLAFVLAPGWAFFSLRSAAITGDVPGLAELVDYGAVRSSLRPQLTDDPQADAPAPSFIEDPIGAIRRRLGDSAPAPDIDAYLTPQALAALTFGEGRYASERSRPGSPPPAADPYGQPWPRVLHWSPDRARFGVRDDGGSETVFTFRREGLFGWKLSHIGLPEGNGPGGESEAPEGPPQAG
ncbi:DUF2939 domain-containing protein [Brevundimonas sp.]|uniref:DUF2939 domain-containing protein n=1 Tax=Brevundimonas sp. TaxID=1871086 RepID=UPI0025F22A44|nr:DUF2939 domain-containing protein [Brevundimonas sp.]